MRHTILTAACLAALSTPALAFDFSTSTQQKFDSNVLEVVVAGDVNGDQLDDVVVAMRAVNTGAEGTDFPLFVFLQQPDGTLAAPLKYADGNWGGYDLADMALGDLNKDGVLDVVHCHDNGLTLLFSNGAGFSKTSVPMQGTSTWTCRLAGVLDVNGDGNLDVVTQSASLDGGMTIFFGNGQGGISRTAPLATLKETYLDMEVGDVTGDGFQDVVLVSAYNTVVYPRNSTGSLGPLQVYRTSDTGVAREAAIGDFNHDGRNDVAVSIMRNSPEAGVWIYSQTSSGVLGTPAFHSGYDQPAGMVATDLDRDGLTDLLVGHATGQFGFYMQGTTGLSAEVLPSQGAVYQAIHRALAIADVNGDGCSDGVAIDSIQGLNTLLGSGCLARKVTADFDADGKSDLVWRNAQTGANVIWRAADSSRRQAMATVALAWQVAGSGDFNGDGRGDLLWRNASTGSNTIWLSGTSTTQRGVTGVTNLDWQIVGIGDFDGDGKDDVLWRNRLSGANTIWKAGVSSTQLPVAPVADVHWKVAGIADFDHDHRADILWRNDATGANTLWPAANPAAKRALASVTNLAWTVAGTGDFDGDGKADILWRNASTGSNTIWRAANSTTQMPVAALAGNWSIVIGDYNGDGKVDLLWRNLSTGANALWRAGQQTVQLPVTAVTDTAWKTVR
jgi:hypothetical protein